VPVLHDFLPFDIPKFEYDSASPFVKKCIGCPIAWRR